jgi:hypothetical protein
MLKRLAVAIPMLSLLLSVPLATAQPATKAYTFLIYMDGDNNLDAWGHYNLDEMVAGLSNDANIYVSVLYDHLGSAGADLLQVTAGSGVVKIANYPEPDMGSPETLRQYLCWGVSAYPAEHYVVVVWDHGGGWKSLLVDDTSGSRMMLDGFGHALESVAAQLGRKLDMVVFDACLMSMVEVADQLKNAADHTVSSQAEVAGQGFPYHLLLDRLSRNPDQCPGDYAKGMVDDFVAYYANKKAIATAFDESKIQPLVAAIDNVSITLINGMAKYRNEIGSARSNAQSLYGGTNGVFWFVDLKVFMDQLAFRIANPTVTAQAAAVDSAMVSATYSRHSDQLDGKENGLSINFPPNKNKYYDKNYLAQNYAGIGLVFPAETHWSEMILASY